MSGSTTNNRFEEESVLVKTILPRIRHRRVENRSTAARVPITIQIRLEEVASRPC
jgi:hypothetical protein